MDNIILHTFRIQLVFHRNNQATKTILNQSRSSYISPCSGERCSFAQGRYSHMGDNSNSGHCENLRVLIKRELLNWARLLLLKTEAPHLSDYSNKGKDGFSAILT